MFKIAFRVSAIPQAGSGHISRCLALASQLKKKGCLAHFFLDPQAKIWQDTLDKESHKAFWLTSAKTSELAQRLKNVSYQALVIDGYEFKEPYQQELHGLTPKMMVIDDMGWGSPTADILLNQNFGFNKEEYLNKCKKDCRLLLGPQYALLREEFFLARNGHSRKNTNQVSKILVSMGGADSKNMTPKVIQALETDCFEKHSFNITVLAGISNEHFDEIQKLCLKSRHQYQLLRHTREIAPLMKQADMAIGAAGSTCWERLCLGLPTITIVIADNQRRIAEDLHKHKLIDNIGWHEEVSVEVIAKKISEFIKDKKLRQSMSHSGMKLVDSKGAEKVANYLINSPGTKQ